MSLFVRIKKIVLLLFLVSLVSGCANIQYQSPAPYQKNLTHTISRSKLLDDTHYTLKHLNANKTVLYHQNYSDVTESVSFWGAIALASATTIGPLIGPVGEAYVMADIESKTENDVAAIKDNLNFEPVNLFRKSLFTGSDISLVENHKQEEITHVSPYIYITNSKDDTLLFSVAMIVQDYSNALPRWQGRYFLQVPMALKKANIINGLQLAQEEKMKRDFLIGFKRLLKVYSDDRKGELNNQYYVNINSDFISPRFDFSFTAELVQEDEDSVVIRVSNGVYVLPRQYTTVEREE